MNPTPESELLAMVIPHFRRLVGDHPFFLTVADDAEFTLARHLRQPTSIAPTSRVKQGVHEALRELVREAVVHALSVWPTGARKRPSGLTARRYAAQALALDMATLTAIYGGRQLKKAPTPDSRSPANPATMRVPGDMCNSVCDQSPKNDQ